MVLIYKEGPLQRCMYEVGDGVVLAAPFRETGEERALACDCHTD